MVRASRLADGAVVKPVETAVKFGPDRSAPRTQTFISPDGDVVTMQQTSVARSIGSLEEQFDVSLPPITILHLSAVDLHLVHV
eukprot:COSAG02_NODE_3438_length_6743_cov_12.416616_3_plen_83_part_00